MDYAPDRTYLAHFQISSKDWQTNTIISCFSYFSHSFLYTFLHDRCCLLCVYCPIYFPLYTFVCAPSYLLRVNALFVRGLVVLDKQIYVKFWFNGSVGSKPNPQENVKVLFFVPCKADIPFFIFLLTER